MIHRLKEVGHGGGHRKGLWCGGKEAKEKYGKNHEIDFVKGVDGGLTANGGGMIKSLKSLVTAIWVMDQLMSEESLESKAMTVFFASRDG